MISQKQLEENKAALEQTNDWKNKLLSILSHDLRTPLNSLRAVLDLFEQGDFNQEQQKYLLAELNKQVMDTSVLMDDLLFWVKGQYQKEELNPEKFYLVEIINQTISILSPEIKLKNLIMDVNVPKDFEVFADRAVVFILTRNILSNACKFSNGGGVVEVFLNNQMLCIKDNGVGMDEQELNKLFDWDKSSKMGTRSEVGIGMGLTLVQEFVQKLDGKLEVSSQKGAGTTFQICFW